MFIFSRIAGFLIDALMQLFSNNYIITLCVFAVIVKAVTMPISIAGQKMSAKYKRLKPQIKEIKNSGYKQLDIQIAEMKKNGPVPHEGYSSEEEMFRAMRHEEEHEVERKLNELYDKYQVKLFDFLIGPLSTVLWFFIIVGLVRAVTLPLTYVLRLSPEEVSTLAGIYNTASQTSILSAFIQSPSLAATAIPFEDYNSLFAFAMGMTKSGWDLSQIPTAQYLLWLPILTLAIYLVKEGFSIFYAWFFAKEVPTFTLVMCSASILLTALFAFTLPAGMCVYWSAGAVVSLAINVFRFVRKYKQKKRLQPEKVGNIFTDKEKKSPVKKSA